MKKLLSLIIFSAITIMASAQKDSNNYKPCDECFRYQQINVDGYNNVNSIAERQYNQTCINGLNYENGYERPRHEFGNRILRIAIGLVSFAVIVAILPRHDTPYIQ